MDLTKVFNLDSFSPDQPPREDGGDAPAAIEDGDIETNWDEVIESFDGMDLREDLLRGIYAYGFEKPSAIQQVGHSCSMDHKVDSNAASVSVR